MTEAEKAVYDEEDPEIPADLFSLWAKTEFTDDEDADDVEEPAERAESAGQEQIAEAPAELNELADGDPENMATAEHVEFADNASEAETTTEIADDESSETTEPTLDDDEMAYLTSADNAVASAEQETVSDPADDMAESAGQEQIVEAPTELNELADNASEAEATADADGEASETSEPTLDDDEMAYLTSANDVAEASAEQETLSDFADDVVESAELADNASEAEATAEIADDESSESTAPPLDDDEMAYLTSADNAAASAEQETELPTDVPSADAVAESTEVVGASSDVTDDDLDDLIDVPILPLPAESTEVTDDDLAFIRAPILSPGDPVSMPSIPVQADPTVPPAELSSPSIVEIVQEQEAIESLGNLTAPKVTDPLALFKKLRDLAEELPHNVYYAFKASRMCATLDEIIADFEA